MSQDPNFLRPGQRVVVYSKFLEKLDAILATGNIGLDPDQSRWPAYEATCEQSLKWPVGCRPVMLPEGDPRLAQWSISAAQATERMEDAKRIVVAGCRQVLEDGPDVCGSESDAEYSDHGEELEGMYTKGSSLASASLTTAQANALRAQSKGQSVPVPEQRLPTPVPSDGEDLDYEQARALRRFMNKKGRAVGLVTDLGKG